MTSCLRVGIHSLGSMMLIACFLSSCSSFTTSPNGLLQMVDVSQTSHNSKRSVVRASDISPVTGHRRDTYTLVDANGNSVHSSTIAGADEIYNEVALKSSDGDLLGFSLAARGTILGLGWGGRGLVSSDAQLKGWFYTAEEGLIGVSSSQWEPIVTDASEEFACFSHENAVECLALNENRTHTQLTSEEHWVPVEDIRSPYPDVCFGSLGACFGKAMSLWRRSIAISAHGRGGERFVSVHDLQFRGTLSWDCVSGCGGGNFSNVTDADIVDSDPSFGDAVAMQNDLIAVGAPEANGEQGQVHLYMALDAGRRSWRKVQTLMVEGARLFGKSVELRAGLLVVGAPGLSGYKPGVHVYKIERMQSGAAAAVSVEAVRMCEILDDNVEHQSKLGWSIAVDETSEGAVLAVGAPGTSGVDTCTNQDIRENRQCSSRVYLVAVNTEEEKCEARDFVIQDQSEGYGSSVATTLGVVFVGAPDYLKRNWDHSLTSGLVYIFTYCEPGQYSTPEYKNGGLERDCEVCPPGTWSKGGHAMSCVACVPEHSTVIGQCEFECLPTYFGTDCQLCSDSELAVPEDLPVNASWVDHRAECKWQCVAGFHSVDGVTCEPCPSSAEDFNGDWVVGTCGWECKEGFFNDSNSTTPDCVRCSELKLRGGLQAPANSYWIDGWPQCTFVPDVGYQCNKTECVPCPAIPAQANWSDWEAQEGQRCGYACLPRYFGHPTYEGVCVACSELQTQVKAPDDRPTLPDRAFWEDGDTCSSGSWACEDHAVRSPWTDDMGVGYCCPKNISNAVADVTATPCQVRCLDGFWWRMSNAMCAACPLKPNNSHWVEGNCTYGPDLGYWCNTTLAECFSCGARTVKPPNAEWIQQDAGQAECPYKCKTGYFGHPYPTFWGECMRCKEYLNKFDVIATSKPQNSDWNNDVTECNGDSWVCNAGFQASAHSDYCCPTAIPNSDPAAGVAPCDILCKKGFWWDHTQAACRPCGARPERSEWNETGTCSWECVMGYYPWQNQCLACTEYRTARGTYLPPNAVWDDGSGHCSALDWTCRTGFDKSLVAEPPGCCPGASGGRGGVPGGVPGTDPTKCNWDCITGWMWDAENKQCMRCEGWVAGAVAPDNAHWNDTLCAFQCDFGYKSQPPNPTGSPERCLDCPTQGREQGWWKPANSKWPTGPQPRCSNNSWECSEGFVQHGKQPKCCNTVNTYVPKEAVSLTAEGRGGWVHGECRWECTAGFHPREPKREWYGKNLDCLPCDEYLSQLGVNCSTCIGKKVRSSALECFAAAQAVFQLANLRAAAFSLQAQSDFLLAVAATLEDKVSDLDLDWQALKIGPVREIAARRKSRPELAEGGIVRRSGLVLEVVVWVEKLEPANIVKVQVALVASPQQIQQNMKALGYSMQVLDKVEVEVGPAEDAWECQDGYTRNDLTGQCCNENWLEPPPDDPLRYSWNAEGCNWECRDGYRGAKCLTCAEYNAILQRFKPPNSVWEANSEDCSSWKCVDGYVKSSTGFSCVSLTQLYQVCTAKNHRCADCLKQEDCVWCPEVPSSTCDNGEDCAMGSCLPGRGSSVTNEGWMYMADGNLTAAPTCQGDYCTDECQHRKCSDCVEDRACGWCISSERCMQGDQVRPEREVCRAGWLFISSHQCGSDQGLWLIGLIVACMAMLVVGLCCCFCIVKVRMRIQQQEQQVIQAQQNQADVRRITSRFLATFPTFKYNGNRPNSSPNGTLASSTNTNTNDDDDEDPSCSICLGDFAEGEECRMLPCLHVFHRPCIDQWLNVSHECPLCKQSVINQGNAHLVQGSSFVQEQGLMFGGSVGGMIQPPAPPTGAAPSAPPATEVRSGPAEAARPSGEVEMVSAITFNPSPLRPHPQQSTALRGASSSQGGSSRSLGEQGSRQPEAARVAPSQLPAPVEERASPPAGAARNADSLSPHPMESDESMSPRGAASAARRGPPVEVEMRTLAPVSGSSLSLRFESGDERRPPGAPSPAPAQAAGAGTTAVVAASEREKKGRREKPESKQGSFRSNGPAGLQDDGVGDGEQQVGTIEVTPVAMPGLALEEPPTELLAENEAGAPDVEGPTSGPKSGPKSGREVAC